MATPSDLIKIRLTDRGEDSETPWAHDLGPTDGGPDGSRRVRLANIPFLHAKPTFGDVLVVAPDPADGDDGFLTWDRAGVSWRKISSRIAEDSGNWAMIVDYSPRDGITSEQAWEALRDACDKLDITIEGAWGPDEKPGRAYLAIAADVGAETIMERLAGAALPLELAQIHPKPAAKPKAKAKPAPKAKAQAKKPAPKKAQAKKPAPKAKAKAKPKAKAKAKPKAKAKRK